ncbi:MULTISPECIES: PepSY domain-containing protein [Euryhalocaulis]|uniref:PepSY domain-containing protein n=1 Tax=Euryhalocaulis TaxID=1712422 RepID=UPI0003B7501D|nr:MULTISPECIES: PepSY domain-containing protein [Euryhalocaulis]MBA4802774.1 PepSY domain-containing protein [Euryhalocaulis sp.]
MKLVTLISAAFLTAASLCGTAAAGSQDMYAQMRSTWSADQARNAQEEGRVLPASQIIRIAQARHRGSQVLDVSLSGGRTPVYTVILKTRDGRRVDVTLDARTGRILSERGA